MTDVQVANAWERWNRFWFSQVPTHSFALLRIFFGLVTLMSVTGLWGLFRVGDLRMRFPRDPVFAIGGLHDGVAMPYPGLSWLPVPAPGVYSVLETLVLFLVVLMIVGLATRVVVPALALTFTYLFLTTQWNFHHHTFLMAIVLVVLATTRCGDHYSIDAVLRGRRDPGPSSVLPLRLLQVLVVQLYVFTYLSKVGSGWLTGDVIVMLANEGRIRGALAPLVLDTVGPQAMGVATVVAEGFIAIGLLHPRMRQAALFVGVLLHLGIDALMDVGTFSYQMLALYIVFIHPVAGASVAVYDGACRSCRRWPDRFAPLDLLRRLSWVDLHDPAVRAALPEHVWREGRGDLLVVRPDGRVETGPDAWRYVLSRSPFTFLLGTVLYVPPLRWLADWLWSVLRSRREPGPPDSDETVEPSAPAWEASLARAGGRERLLASEVDPAGGTTP